MLITNNLFNNNNNVNKFFFKGIFQEYNGSCIVPETGKPGNILHQKYCPFNAYMPPACEYSICKDFVCCPIFDRKPLIKSKK